MNVVALMGRITTKPKMEKAIRENKEINYTTFTLAVNEKYNRKKVNFINCVAFENAAKIIIDFIEKGQQLSVSGYLKQSNYKGKNGYTVVVENFDFGDYKKNKIDEEDIFPF